MAAACSQRVWSAWQWVVGSATWLAKRVARPRPPQSPPLRPPLLLIPLPPPPPPLPPTQLPSPLLPCNQQSTTSTSPQPPSQVCPRLSTPRSWCISLPMLVMAASRASARRARPHTPHTVASKFGSRGHDLRKLQPRGQPNVIAVPIGVIFFSFDCSANQLLLSLFIFWSGTIDL